MTDPIQEMKARAEILQHRLEKREPLTLPRLRVLPEYRRSTEGELWDTASVVLRRQCLSIIAIEFGFSGWNHAAAVVTGVREESDFGTLLYPKRCGGHLNLWYRSHAEAVIGRETSGGYLLAYRRDFLVVTRSFIDVLGLDPDDPAWEKLGYDWAEPRDLEARRRLYGELISQMPREVRV